MGAKLKISALMIAVLCLSVISVQSQSFAELMSQGELLEKNMKETQALFKYKQALKMNPESFKANYKVSWLSSRVGFRVTDMSKKREYFETSKSTADKALALNKNSADAYFVKALAAGRMAQISGAKQRVAMLKDIKFNSEKCVTLDPKHAGGYHLLGRLNYRVSNLSAAEKTAANLILGGVPKGMSNENAVKFFEKSCSIRPDYILYWKDLALAYVKVKNKPKAIAALKKALSLPVKTEDDPGYKLSCKSMLNKLQ